MLQQAISPKDTLQETQPYWSEHITTLMALEVQFVFHKRPNNEQRADNDKKTKKRKNIQYESGFLFSGRKEDKQVAENIEQLVMSSHCQKHQKIVWKMDGVYVLEKMIKTMLSLKHSTIVKEFIELYEEVIKKIVKIDFDAIREDERRRSIVAKLAEQISKIIKNKSKQQHAVSYKQLGHFMSSKEKDMLQFLKAVVYCFLAELHNFNINEYYVQAFSFEEEERRLPNKKKKPS